VPLLSELVILKPNDPPSVLIKELKAEEGFGK